MPSDDDKQASPHAPTIDATAARDPLVGATLAHYRIVSRLGQGGMGVVYRAEDEKLRRPVALKLLQEAGSDERRQRFLREARSAASITHPNVAVVHAVDESDGRIYIAMELVEGENLRTRLDRGRLDLATAKDLAMQIARGLAAAHDKGIVHRDLKPENVMITPAGMVKLLDFGLAKAGVAKPESGRTEVGLAKTETLVTSDEGRVMGTPGYMSPEQAAGEALDVRSDVFSFGIVLYEMLTGARPFEGESTAAVLAAILRDEPLALRTRAPEVDEAAAAIVTRCLAKKPGERFANAGAVVAALNAQTSPKATTASRTDVEAVTRSGVAPRRSRVGVVALGVVGVAVVLGCVRLWQMGWWGMGPGRAPSVAAATGGAAPSGSAGAPHRGKAITDYPPPKTDVPEAAAAYARALRAMRGASWTLATDELERSTKLDPSLAAAQLRAALHGGTGTRQREHLAAAEQLRAVLDDRDQLLLKVAEATLADPPIPDDVINRLRDVVRRFPDDAEASVMLGDWLAWDRRDEDRAELHRALELDPEYADALYDLAASYQNEDKDRAVDYATQCLQIAPSAGSCLRQRALAYLDRGQCAKLEADARTMTIVEPNGRGAYLFLARALAAESAPLEAIEEALRKRAAVAPEGDVRSEVTMENSLALALLTGDLLAAEAAARRGMALAEGAQLESEHAPPLEVLIDVLEERGEPERALAEGEAYERHAAAWTADAPFGAHLRILFLRHELGRTDLPALNVTLAALHDKQTSRGGLPFCWTSEEGLLVSGAEQASRVLAEVPDSGGWRTSGFFPVGLGRTLLLAGQPAAAVEPLRAAANSCAILTDELGPAFYSGTIWWMRAHVLLGQALEQTGDNAGACAAYAVVMDRWKNAKPRSITLEKAKERSRALSCKP